MNTVEMSAIKPANNAKGSVTTDTFELDMANCPDKKKEVWDGMIFTYLRYLSWHQETFNLLDCGCGAGTQVTRIAQEAKALKLNTHVAITDLIPQNLHSTKQKLKKHGISPETTHLGDIAKKFPDGVFDWITAFNLIHWFSPEKIEQYFSDCRQHIKPGGRLILSYATINNNASLRNQRGELSYKRLPPQNKDYHYKWSNACQTWMTFPNPDWLGRVANAYGFKNEFYYESYNPYFPSTKGIGLRSPNFYSHGRYDTATITFVAK